MRKFASASALAVMALSGAVAIAPASAATPSQAARPISQAAKLLAQGTKSLKHLQPGGPLAFAGGQRSMGKNLFDSQNVVSNNWGGFAGFRHGTKFRYIEATFFVPYVNCTTTPSSFSGHWVGIDGFGNSTVEQDGILAACDGSTPEYAAWYEMFPLPPVYKNVAVEPGDSIVASVYYNSGANNYKLSLTDTTNGQGFTVVKSCPAGSVCDRATVEAISEAPSSSSSILPLTDFSAESYGSIKVTDRAGQRGGLHSGHWNTAAITTENADGDVLDQPTQISRGTAFDMYWMRES